MRWRTDNRWPVRGSWICRVKQQEYEAARREYKAAWVQAKYESDQMYRLRHGFAGAARIRNLKLERLREARLGKVPEQNRDGHAMEHHSPTAHEGA